MSEPVLNLRLDVLPAGCDIEAQVNGLVVRFRAHDAEGRMSEWSGWFPITAGAPVHLTWSAFWVEP